MLTPLLQYFQLYPQEKAPFMHLQFSEWKKIQPLAGLKVLHHVPVVANTLLKIGCLIAAGAEVVVTNPNFMSPQPEAIAVLKECGIAYVSDLSSLRGENFDLYFDCGAELYQTLGAPKIGAVELTASGDYYYRQRALNFPVISIDRTFTKQLETVFGTAVSANLAMSQLIGLNLTNKSWLVFGFGKIGRGIAYFCNQNNTALIIADTDPNARQAAESFGIRTINPHNSASLQTVLLATDCVVTATGKKSILDSYPKEWFKNKILANMGILDEYGADFAEHEVLNNKLPVNFILGDPTPMQYIDPEFYAHNIAALEIMSNSLTRGVHDFSKEFDQTIIQRWCQFHNFSVEQINKWFIK